MLALSPCHAKTTSQGIGDYKTEVFASGPSSVKAGDFVKIIAEKKMKKALRCLPRHLTHGHSVLTTG